MGRVLKMSLREAQEEVDEWANQHKVPYWTPHEILARLTEELGELAREVNHTHGPKKKKTATEGSTIKEEMGDVLFTLICLANSQKIDLDESFQKAMTKCYGRDKNRFEKK